MQDRKGGLLIGARASVSDRHQTQATNVVIPSRGYRRDSRRAFAVAAALVVLLPAMALAGPTPEQRCEGGKNEAAGEYDTCAAKAEKNLVTKGDLTKYAASLVKCEEKLVKSWDKLEADAVADGAVCPSTGDQAAIQNFVDACVQSVAVAVGGGALGSDPVTCAADLGTCNGSLGTCTGSLGTCNGDLSTSNANLASCTGNLGTCNGDLGTCNGSLGTCNGSLGTCTGNLGTCNSDLGTCNGDLGTCNGDLGTCNGDLSTSNANLASCTGDLATANGGTAAVGDVLSGKTFTSTAGLGATGTMPNNGAVTLTPTTSNQAIAAGYHDGTGACEGDADLVAGNIKNGVNLFGVTGTVSAGGLHETGQTICYNTAGTVIPCAGTGQDGELQRGIANSFTDNGDGTITDNLSGLMWEKQSDDGTIHDKDNVYTWANAFASKVATLNSTVFAGFSDWRVPNRKELDSLVNLGVVNSATFSAFNTSCSAACTVFTCSCTRSAYHWSSTTYQYGFSAAWVINFDDGNSFANGKTNTSHVRAVRAGS